ncbi:MAG: DUF5615 family PIN-like protein [Egibacteraceae bacterium]
MRLLLDEMFPATIAEALCQRRYDVIAVQEYADLRQLPDAQLFAEAQTRERAVVTENVRDFLKFDVETRGPGMVHYGLVLTTNRAFPRHGERFIGPLVDALTRFLTDHPQDEPKSILHWLTR